MVPGENPGQIEYGVEETPPGGSPSHRRSHETPPRRSLPHRWSGPCVVASGGAGLGRFTQGDDVKVKQYVFTETNEVRPAKAEGRLDEL